jgi:hypothetical protein
VDKLSREIKFRGKRIDNGEWVYGSLREERDWYQAFILTKDYSVEVEEPEYHSQAMGCGVEDNYITDRYEACAYGWDEAISRYNEALPQWVGVDPSAVGQFTGLLDKHGKKIYEGDVAQDGETTIVEILWSSHHQWGCKIIKGGVLCMGLEFPLWQWDKCMQNAYRGLEVIGNIHDNPELLKEGNQPCKPQQK